MTVQIVPIVSAPFEENSYIVYREGRPECVVFDPGLEPQKLFRVLTDRQLTPAAVLCTHGHADHIAGNAAMKQRWPDCPIVIGARDAAKLADPQLNLSAGFGIQLVSPPADQLVEEGELFSAAGLKFEVLDTPGHSIGHVSFVLRDTSPIRVFSGDVLFLGSIGRTDFPDGDFETLRASIHNKLFTLPDDTVVLPGHGPATTIGEEKRANPFVGL